MMIGAKRKSSHCSVILGLAHYKDGFWQFDSPTFFFFLYLFLADVGEKLSGFGGGGI